MLQLWEVLSDEVKTSNELFKSDITVTDWTTEDNLTDASQCIISVHFS